MTDLFAGDYIIVPRSRRGRLGGGDQDLVEVRRQRLEIATKRALALPERSVRPAPERSVVDDEQG
jgi:hypothetical protein